MSTHRFQEWSGETGLRQLARTGVRSPAPTAFLLRSESRDFGAVVVDRLTARAVEFVRPVEAGEQVVECLFVEHGHSCVHCDRVLPAGDATVTFLPTWGEHSLVVEGEATILRLRVVRDAVEQIVPALRSAPVVMPVRPGLIVATYAFACRILEASAPLSAVESYAISQLLSEMVGGMLLDQFGLGAEQRSLSAQLRDRAIAVIAQQRADPQLTVEDVAASVQVSPRRLQAVFAEVETTVSAEIRRQRAALAISLLSSVKYDVLSIEDVAQASGFGSALSMRRAVQELRGLTPSQLRRGRGGQTEP